jgi:hypothetical protein
MQKNSCCHHLPGYNLETPFLKKTWTENVLLMEILASDLSTNLKVKMIPERGLLHLAFEVFIFFFSQSFKTFSIFYLGMNIFKRKTAWREFPPKSSF